MASLARCPAAAPRFTRISRAFGALNPRFGAFVRASQALYLRVYMVPSAGFEPATYPLGEGCSIP